jgi:hypothetical protein
MGSLREQLDRMAAMHPDVAAAAEYVEQMQVQTALETTLLLVKQAPGESHRGFLAPPEHYQIEEYPAPWVYLRDAAHQPKLLIRVEQIEPGGALPLHIPLPQMPEFARLSLL